MLLLFKDEIARARHNGMPRDGVLVEIRTESHRTSTLQESPSVSMSSRSVER